jgi:hypothetical protein
MEDYLYYDLSFPERFGPFLEQWKGIKDFENVYWISDYGNIRSTKNGILKLNKDKNGYVGVCLLDAKNGKRLRIHVHRLVALYFIPNPEDKKCINHKLGVKHQNFIGEIEWVTHQENCIHAFKVLGRTVNQHDNRKKVIYIHFQGEIKESLGIRKTARNLGIPYQAIQGVLRGNTKLYLGFYFSQDVEYIAPENISGKKICNKCKIEKSINDFHKKHKVTLNTCAKCRNRLLTEKRNK